MGHNEFRHYVTIGKAVEDVNLAEKFCSSGDVVLSPSTWIFFKEMSLPNEVCEDGKHVKVKSVNGASSNCNITEKYQLI